MGPLDSLVDGGLIKIEIKVYKLLIVFKALFDIKKTKNEH